MGNYFSANCLNNDFGHFRVFDADSILYTPSVTQCRSIFNRPFAWKNNRNYHPFGFYLHLIIYPNWRICAESERTSVIQQNNNKIKTVTPSVTLELIFEKICSSKDKESDLFDGSNHSRNIVI